MNRDRPQPGSRVRLSRLPEGAAGRVSRVEGRTELLAAYCVYPGSRLQVRQTFPTLVVAARDLEFALEEKLARLVWVVAE